MPRRDEPVCVVRVAGVCAGVCDAGEFGGGDACRAGVSAASRAMARCGAHRLGALRCGRGRALAGRSIAARSRGQGATIRRKRGGATVGVVWYLVSDGALLRRVGVRR